FIHLALVRGAVTEVCQTDMAVLAVAVCKGDASAKRDLRRHDAVTAVELLLDAEHVHRAALPLGIAAAAAGELSHDPFGVHAAGDHVSVIAVAGDDLVALIEGQLHAHDNGFLTDIEVAETANQSHSVELARLLLEAANHQHVAVNAKLEFLAEFGRRVGGAV